MEELRPRLCFVEKETKDDPIATEILIILLKLMMSGETFSRIESNKLKACLSLIGWSAACLIVGHSTFRDIPKW